MTQQDHSKIINNRSLMYGFAIRFVTGCKTGFRVSVTDLLCEGLNTPSGRNSSKIRTLRNMTIICRLPEIDDETLPDTFEETLSNIIYSIVYIFFLHN